MSDIYIVTQGDYSDYHICAVFSTRAAAKLLAEKIGDGYDRAEVEKYTIDDLTIAPDLDFWFVRMARDGTTHEAYMDNGGYYSGGRSYGLTVIGELYSNCLARDKEHAVKITNERRAMLIAEGKWPEGTDQ